MPSNFIFFSIFGFVTCSVEIVLPYKYVDDTYTAVNLINLS